ncbi:hypothetical protein J6590_051686 [Homalodisca vitripennis]|nr:hypothetical protein J6590_051686 [Homalodisca vitripennis]
MKRISRERKDEFTAISTPPPLVFWIVEENQSFRKTSKPSSLSSELVVSGTYNISFRHYFNVVNAICDNLPE